MHNDSGCSCLQTKTTELANVEDGIATHSIAHLRQYPTTNATSVDVLQAWGTPQDAVAWNERLDHDGLIHHFGVRPKNSF